MNQLDLSAWSVATFRVGAEGWDGGESFRVQYRRYTGHDRLQCLRWQQMHLEALADGASVLDLAAGELDAECAAMASRLMDADGRVWTQAELVELNGTRPAAWSWLSDLLYGPYWRDLAQGGAEAKKNYTLLSRAHRMIHRALRVLVQTVSDGSTRNGSQSEDDSGGSSEPTAEAPGQAALETLAPTIFRGGGR